VNLRALRGGRRSYRSTTSRSYLSRLQLTVTPQFPARTEPGPTSNREFTIVQRFEFCPFFPLEGHFRAAQQRFPVIRNTQTGIPVGPTGTALTSYGKLARVLYSVKPRTGQTEGITLADRV
jgi:hypothetical protein